MDPGERPQDADALSARFLALSDRLTGTAFFVLGHREDAREAVQEALKGYSKKRTIYAKRPKVFWRKFTVS